MRKFSGPAAGWPLYARAAAGAEGGISPVRLLTFSTLFPNAEQPNHGIFVETRLRQVLATGAATATVVAPVPYFPRNVPAPGAWARYARVPLREQRHGVSIHHPRFLAIPRLGRLTPGTLYRAGLRAVQRLGGGEAFDLIDAHYLYPDGVAAVRLGAALGLPVVLTARGSDLTQWPDHARPRRLIRAAIARADALIAVSAALHARLLALGADPARSVVLRNGVDTMMFQTVDRAAARAALGVTRPMLLAVGALIPRKRHDLAIAALALLPEFELLIVGEGPERARLAAQIRAAGLAGRARLVGAVAQAELATYYGAAEALVLVSAREGWANVLLEAMACGTPVIASDIPGNDEVVRAPAAGRLVAEATPAAIAAALRALRAAPPTPAATRAYAAQFGWGPTSQGQLEVFRRVLAQRGDGVCRG